MASKANNDGKVDFNKFDGLRVNVPVEVFEALGAYLSDCVARDLNDEILNKLNVIYKTLSRHAVENKHVQIFVAKEAYILENTEKNLISFLEGSRNLASVNCAKKLLQFLTNLVVGNAESGVIVWQRFERQFVTLLSEKEFGYWGSALLYNILRNCEGIAVPEPLIHGIFALNQAEPSIEFGGFLLEYIAACKDIPQIYHYLNAEERMTVLEVLKEGLVSPKVDIKLQPELLAILIRDFKLKSDCILKTVTDYLKDVEPEEVSLLLDVLATVSGQEEHLHVLQSDKSFLINCVFLLRSIHVLGKECANNFATLGKLADESAEELDLHPAFGFKGALVRVIGNLCWKHTENQDEVRELDCIPLLLECCNIDARNPFITQWCIVAIRNLCHKNTANQAVIASMTRQGVVNTRMLHEMGITLLDDGENKLRIAPLDMQQK